MKFRSLIRGRPSTPPPPGYSPDIAQSEGTDELVTHEGETYQCETIPSSAGTWHVSYGMSPRTQTSRVFVFHHDNLAGVLPVGRVIDAAIADDGTVLLLEGGAFDAIDGRISVFSGYGEELLREPVKVNLRNCAISASGAWAAAVTRPPNVAVYLIDVREREIDMASTFEDTQVEILGFAESEDEKLVYLAEPQREEPFVAYTMEGERAWGSSRFRDTQPFSERVKAWFRSSNGTS